MSIRRFEFGTALLTLALGITALLYSLFGPVVTEESVVVGSPERHSRSYGLADGGLEPIAAVFLLVAFALLLTITTAGIIDSSRDDERARHVLWCASIAFLFGATLTVMTLGWMFLPAAVAGIVVAFLSHRAPTANPGSTSATSSGSSTG